MKYFAVAAVAILVIAVPLGMNIMQDKMRLRTIIKFLFPVLSASCDDDQHSSSTTKSTSTTTKSTTTTTTTTTTTKSTTTTTTTTTTKSTTKSTTTTTTKSTTSTTTTTTTTAPPVTTCKNCGDFWLGHNCATHNMTERTCTQDGIKDVVHGCVEVEYGN